MKLLKLSLKNFKGAPEFVFEPNGHNASVFGDNATCKTTLVDASHWLLFDKDSHDKKDFAIKTLDKDGNVIHNLEHEVEGVYEIDGKVVTLRKVFSEKWTKKRGQTRSEFTGHTTDYYIDGVPKPKKDYDSFIAGIINEDIFKMLTNPQYFNEMLHWQARREILLDVCGDLSDEEVIASSKALSKLPEILKGRKLEDHRKVIAARRAEINKELDKIPVRIDEVSKSLPDITQSNVNGLQAEIEKLQEQIREKEQELHRIETGGEISEKQLKIREIDAALLQLKNEHRIKVDEMVDKKRFDLADLKECCVDLRIEISSIRKMAEQGLTEITELEVKNVQLRDFWHSISSTEFDIHQDETCPTCGQPIPQNKLQDALDKALAEFNRKKAEELENISQHGKNNNSRIETIRESLRGIDQRLAKLEPDLTSKEKLSADLQAEIDGLISNVGNIEDDPTYQSKLVEKKAIADAIIQLLTDSKDAAQAIKSELISLSNALAARQKALAQVDQYQQGQERIKELEDQERVLAAEYEKLEGELDLTDQFIRAKVGLLEDKINSRFHLAKFKLFDVQVNGGIVECCETTYNGVPFSSGLNTGHRNAVGMDIINTLSEHYNFYPPLWVDNAESITVLPKMKTQVIRLVVSEPDKTLRVEIENGKGGKLFE